MSAASTAIWRLVTSASVYACLLNGCRQLSSVNSFQVMLNLPLGLLNENTTITTIGREEPHVDEERPDAEQP